MGRIGTLLEASTGQPDSRQSRTSGSGRESFKRRWKCGDRNCRSAGRHSGCVLSFSSQLVFDCPHSIVRLPASTDNRILNLPQAGNSREKWIGGRLADRARKIFEAIIGKTHGSGKPADDTRGCIAMFTQSPRGLFGRHFWPPRFSTRGISDQDPSHPLHIYALHIDTRTTGPSIRRLTSIQLSPRVPRHRLLSDTCSV